MDFIIAGLKVKISFYFFAIMSILCLYSDNSILVASIFFILLHELAHIVAFVFFKQPIQEIILLPFGVKILRNDNINCSYFGEIIIYMAGVTVNAAVFVVTFHLYKTYNSYDFFIFSSINLVLCIFNLLPISVLDGGNILRITLINLMGLNRGENISEKISIILSLLIFFIILFLNTKFNVNYSLIITSVYLVISNFSILNKNRK